MITERVVDGIREFRCPGRRARKRRGGGGWCFRSARIAFTSTPNPTLNSVRGEEQIPAHARQHRQQTKEAKRPPGSASPAPDYFTNNIFFTAEKAPASIREMYTPLAEFPAFHVTAWNPAARSPSTSVATS